jgi:glycosyltransferase involved in cell wall biosynthesis
MATNGPIHGIARYIVRLLEIIPQQAPDMTFSLLVPRGALAQARRRFPEHELIPVRARPFSLLEQVELPFRVALSRPDLVHFPSIALAHCPGPFVITVHDLIPFLMQPSLIKRLYAHLVLRPLTRRAAGVIVPSYHTKQDITSLLGVPDSRVRVSYNGVDRTGKVPESRKVAERYGLNRPFLMCVGNPKPHKNLAFLLQAFAGLDLPLQLLLVSSSSPELSVLTNVDSRVVRVHPLSEQDLKALYSTAWAVVSPSLYEGFGLTPAEAMAWGTPVLVSHAASLPEVVGDAGLLFDPTDENSLRAQILRLYHDPQLYDRLATEGPRRVRDFRWEDAASRHVEIYRGIHDRSTR